LVGESKADILAGLAPSGAVARYILLPASQEIRERLSCAQSFIAGQWPVVLKPDVGERGSGVVIVRSEQALETHLRAATRDMILQEYVSGVEFGVFYCRGRILSITHKQFPCVIGDGESTLERLILSDARAVAISHVYLDRHPDASRRIPASGERVQLVEVGSHCRGAVFVDGSEYLTEALTRQVDEVARTFPGFYFGRFDVRSPSLEHFMRGEFLVLELNGVSSEPTHIYDPKVSIIDAYRAMFEQWRLAFLIGAENRRAQSPQV
jgi:hypothetical protein